MKNPPSEPHSGWRVLHVVNGLDAAGITSWPLALARQQAEMGWTAHICLLARKHGALVPLRARQLLARRGQRFGQCGFGQVGRWLVRVAAS